VSRQPGLFEPLSMSAASVRTSGRRDNFPVFSQAAGIAINAWVSELKNCAKAILSHSATAVITSSAWRNGI
jgi:hypothetical protein